MLNYFLLAALCVCVYTAPLDKLTTTAATTTTSTTTTTTTTPKVETKHEPIDNLTTIAHPGAHHKHPITKRQYDHHPVAVVVGHDHYISGAAFHAPILVSDDHAGHATHADISLGNDSQHPGAAVQPSTTVDSHARSKDERSVKEEKQSEVVKPVKEEVVEKEQKPSNDEKSQKLTSHQEHGKQTTTTTTQKTVDTKKTNEATTHPHPSVHLHAQIDSSTTSPSTPNPNHKNHKRNAPVEASSKPQTQTHNESTKSQTQTHNESTKLASNPTIASPAVASNDHSKSSTDSVKSKVTESPLEHPKAHINDSEKSKVTATPVEQHKATSETPVSSKTDKPQQHKHKRDASAKETKHATMVESAKKEIISSTLKSVKPEDDKKAHSVVKTTETIKPDDKKTQHGNGEAKKETTNEQTKQTSTEHEHNIPEHAHHKREATKETTSSKDTKSIPSTNASQAHKVAHTADTTTEKANDHKDNTPKKDNENKETKETSKPGTTKSVDSKDLTHDSPKNVATVHSHGTVHSHEHHKRETKDDKVPTSASLSNPTIASPTELLKSGKSIPITETKEPTKPESPKDFHTSHRIPEHIDAARQHEEDKFHTSHQIPSHQKPVVVGVTPKKPESTTKTDSTKDKPVIPDIKEEKQKEEPKDKKTLGSRHRRDTVETTSKPIPTKKPELVKVPLMKSKPVETVKSKHDAAKEQPKQQNGHAAHSEVSRPKRDSKDSAESKSSSAEEHHSKVVFPVPVAQIVKHTNAAPEIHNSHPVGTEQKADTTKDQTSKVDETENSHKLDKKHVVNQHQTSTTNNTEIPSADSTNQSKDAAVSVKQVV